MVWIRPASQSWERSLRNPVLGHTLELRQYQDMYCVHIDSQKAKKLIWSNC